MVDNTVPASPSEPEKKASAGENKNKSRQKDRKVSLLPLWLVMLLLLLAGIAAGAWLYLQIEQQQRQIVSLTDAAKTLQRDQQSVRSEQGDALKQLQQLSQQRERAFEQFSQRVESTLAGQAQRLAQMSANSRSLFLLNEAQFLLRQASQRAQLERNGRSAAALFSLADQLLAKLADEQGNPNELLAARKQLATDLNQLQTLQAIDYSGIYFALDGLAENLNSTALVQPPQAFKAEVAAAVEQPPTSGWWARSAHMWRAFVKQVASFVRVRDHQQAIKPLLSETQEALLREHIKLKIQLAQWAMLRGDSALFVATLNQLQQWIQDSFPETELRAQVLEQMQQLQTATIEVAVPDVSATARMLETYRSKMAMGGEVAL